jgi:hypothetical protein
VDDPTWSRWNLEAFGHQANWISRLLLLLKTRKREKKEQTAEEKDA